MASPLWSTSGDEEELLGHDDRQVEHLRNRAVCLRDGKKENFQLPSLVLRV